MTSSSAAASGSGRVSKRGTRAKAPAASAGGDAPESGGYPSLDVAAEVDALLRPAAVRLPIPPVPEDPEDVAAWLEVYRAQMELTRFDAEMVRLQVERAKAEHELASLDLDREQRQLDREKAQLELQRARLDLAEAKRKDLERSSEPSEAMVYTFSKEVGRESVQEAIATLGEWSRRRPQAPLVLQLTSPGGQVLHGLALYDFLLTLRQQGHFVRVVGLGFCASMGSILLQAGDERVLGPNSYVMLHEVSSVSWGKVSEQLDDLEFSKRLQERLIAILCERSTLTPAKLRRLWRKTDIWLDSEQALELGLVDRIESAPAVQPRPA